MEQLYQPVDPRLPRHSKVREVLLLGKECVVDVFCNLIRGRLSVCTIWPTPRKLSHAMIDEFHLKPGQNVLELGSGTGPVTAALDKRMPVGCHALSIELNPRLCRFAQARLPHMNIVEGNALDLQKFMDDADMPVADAVISGLPIPSMPDEILDPMYERLAARMAPDAIVTQITALAREKYKRKYGQYFEQVTYVPVPHFPYWRGGFYKLEGPKKRK